VRRWAGLEPSRGTLLLGAELVLGGELTLGLALGVTGRSLLGTLLMLSDGGNGEAFDL
jgi:hypothetical protein